MKRKIILFSLMCLFVSTVFAIEKRQKATIVTLSNDTIKCLIPVPDYNILISSNKIEYYDIDFANSFHTIKIKNIQSVTLDSIVYRLIDSSANRYLTMGPKTTSQEYIAYYLYTDVDTTANIIKVYSTNTARYRPSSYVYTKYYQVLTNRIKQIERVIYSDEKLDAYEAYPHYKPDEEEKFFIYMIPE